MVLIGIDIDNGHSVGFLFVVVVFVDHRLINLHPIAISFIEIVRIRVAEIGRGTWIDANALKIIEHDVDQKPMTNDDMTEESPITVLSLVRARADLFVQVHETRCVKNINRTGNN